MALDKSDVLGSIFTGWWEADKADTAQKLKTRGEELRNKQAIVKQMKTTDYNKDIAKYDADKKVIDGLNSVAVNQSMYKDDIQLGEAVLMAKHGDKFADFKKNLTGPEGDLTSYYNFAKSEGNSFNTTGTEGTLVSKNFKDKSIIDAEYTAAIAEIEKDTKEAIDAAAGDSKTINAILKLKNRLVNNISTDTKNVKTIDSVNETIKATGSNETETLKKIESNIKTDGSTEEITDDSTEEVSTLKSADIPLFIPKTYKDDFKKKIEKAKEINYSDKKYQTQFADTILTFIPKSEKDKYFTEDNDGNLKAKTAIINADVTIQSLIKNSLEDVTLINTFKVTGNNKNKIDLNANKRFDLAKSHVEDYGSWMSEDKLMNSKSITNMFKSKSIALVVPSNSIINVNNDNLKGYDIDIGKVDRKGVAKVYRDFIIGNAESRQKIEGGTLEENINYLQRQLEGDNNGDNQFTKDAREVIARHLSQVQNDNGELTYPKLTEKKETTSSSETSSSSNKLKTSSTMDMKQKEMEDVTIGNVRTVMVDINGDGTKTPVPLTTKNKKILEANKISIPVVEEDIMTGDGVAAEQAQVVNPRTNENIIKEKIKPSDVGIGNSSGYFETLDSIKAILPNGMSGQEIMDKYNIAFPINKFTVYKPSN